MSENTTGKRPRGRPKSVWAESHGTIVQALDRGLILLIALAKADKISLTELAQKVDMPPSSVHRLLNTLQKHEFAEFDKATQDWMVGVEAFRIGNTFVQRTNLIEVARPTMQNLMQDTGETANLGIIGNGDIIFVNQVETNHPIRAFFQAGTRSHIHASGIGKALLADFPREEVEKILTEKGLTFFTDKTLITNDAIFADLAKIKSRGWSLDDEERYSGMRCVAASIYNSLGEAIAGISVSGPTVRFSDQRVDELGPKVKRAANEVTRMIGGEMPH